MKRTMFQEIEDFRLRGSEGHSSTNSSFSDFLDTTLEAYESHIVIASQPSTQRSNSFQSDQLQFIQGIFDNVDGETDVASYDCNISLKIIDNDKRTTLMIRNIPLNYTREMLKAEIDTKFITKYDYLNFPYDFKICQSVGYAFINLRNKLCLREFYNTFNGRKWNYPSSTNIKPCFLRYARVQQKRKQIPLKPIRPQIYLQQNILKQLVQSQKEQCNM